MASGKSTTNDDQREMYMKNIGLAQFKDEMRRLKEEALNDLSDKLDHLISKSDFSRGTDVLLKSYVESGSSSQKKKRKHRRTPSGNLPEKEFVLQNSVITDLFMSRHFQTIENIVIAGLILWAISTALSDYSATKSLSAVFPSLDLVRNAFDNYAEALIIWIRMMITAFICYPIVLFWASNRPQTAKPNSFDRIFLIGYVFYQGFLLWIPYRNLFVEANLGPAAAIAVTLEQIRLMMKTHAFTREIARRIFKQSLHFKNDDDSDSSSSLDFPSENAFPGFSKYLYFVFAPTLVYRDQYPKTDRIRWGYVLSNFAQVYGCIIFMYYVMVRYLQPEFTLYSPHSVSIETLLTASFRCILPGSVILVMAFFGFLHSWLNAWAEMLRFGDRLFYKDWWNVASYADYYRTWNCVVHDWLYTYIYKDVIELVPGQKRGIASLSVFLTSAIFHEYVIVAMLKFFFPVMLVQFGGLGFFFSFIKANGRLANVIVWTSIIFGMGLMISMYSFEISARRVCPPAFEHYLLDAIIPRFWACMK